MALPKFADSVEEVTLVRYLVEPGDYVFEDDDIIEVESQKGNTMIKSSFSGMVSGYLIELDSDMNIGDEYCEIDTDAPKPEKKAKPVESAPTEKKETVVEVPKEEPKKEVKPTIEEVVMPASGNMCPFFNSKDVRRLIRKCLV